MKAFDGMLDGAVNIGVLRNLGKWLEDMGSSIGGSEDALAVYIRKEPDIDYWDKKSLPEAIAGLVWLDEMPTGLSIKECPEDKKYPLGWPARKTAFRQGPELRQLVRVLYPATFSATWDHLCLNLKDGKPFRIDRRPFAELSDALTGIYRGP